MASGVSACASMACNTASFISATDIRKVFEHAPLGRARWQMYAGICFLPPVWTTNPPPHTPHVASPASRLTIASFGGRPEIRPLSNRVARPSVSARRAATRCQSGLSIIRSASLIVVCHSEAGRSEGASLPHAFFFLVLFQTTTPAYVDRMSTVRIVDGDQPTTGERPSAVSYTHLTL